jgi:hypothetical protein
MNGTTYFWRNDQLEIINQAVFVEHFKQSSMLKYLYCPCVVINENGRQWEGYYDQTENYKVGWMPADLKRFDPAFRLSLLIMGVPVS